MVDSDGKGEGAKCSLRKGGVERGEVNSQQGDKMV